MNSSAHTNKVYYAEEYVLEQQYNVFFIVFFYHSAVFFI